MCHSNNKYMRDYYKNKELSYLKYQDVNNSNGWAMLQQLPVNNFGWIEDTSPFNKNSGRKIMTEFVGLRAKTYRYLIHDCSEDKKAKGTKMCAKLFRSNSTSK